MSLRYIYNSGGTITAQVVRPDDVFDGLRVIAAYTFPTDKVAEFMEFMEVALDMANRQGFVEACNEYDKEADNG